MTTTTSEKEVLALLHKLGNSANEVYRSLKERGCRARPMDGERCSNCPVAVYLQSQGVAKAKVFPDAADWEDRHWYVGLPAPVRSFVFAFDVGDYPDLDPALDDRNDPPAI